MSFVHPAIAMATLGLAFVPWVIHLINRRRFKREPWAAMIFLLKAHRRSQRRIRFENWLLLAVRTLVILLIGLAIARPYVASGALGLVLESPRYDRVIIIDDSLSMQARRADGTSAFDAARDVAIKVIDQAGPRDGLAVLTVSSPPRTWMDRPVHDAAAVSHIVESLRCTATSGDLASAVDRASALLSRGDAVEGCRVVYILTDLTRSSIAPKSSDDNTARSPDATPIPAAANIDRLLFVNVGPQARSNLSISGLRLQGQVLGTRVPVRLAFNVENHGDQPVINARVELRLDDRILHTLKLDPLLPNERRPEGVDLLFPTAGPHRITAILISPAGDVLEMDNRCYLSVHVASHLAVLLVEGDASADPVRQALFYYRAALDSQSNLDTGSIFHTKTVGPGQLDGELLDDYEVIILGDVARLSERTWARLTQYVWRGGGLVMFLGDHVQPANYGRYAAGTAAEPGVLPVRLDALISVDDSDKAVRFEAGDNKHPLLTDFTGHDRGGLFLARVRSYWHIAPANAQDSPTDSTRTVLRLTNGEPALLSTELESGRVLIWLLGPNMEAGTLPAKPDFLPLMHNATVFAAGDAIARRNVTVGDIFIQRIDARSAGDLATVTLPDGRTTQVRPEPSPVPLGFTARRPEETQSYKRGYRRVHLRITDWETSHVRATVSGDHADPDTLFRFSCVLSERSQVQFWLLPGAGAASGELRVETDQAKVRLAFKRRSDSLSWHRLTLPALSCKEKALALRFRWSGAAEALLLGEPVLLSEFQVPPPPVVLISIDTLRADRWAKGSLPKNLEQFRRDAHRFSRAYSSFPTTPQSHSVMLSGRFYDEVLSTPISDALSLASDLRDRGHTTMAFVVGHTMEAQHGFGEREPGFALGFDLYFEGRDHMLNEEQVNQDFITARNAGDARAANQILQANRDQLKWAEVRTLGPALERSLKAWQRQRGPAFHFIHGFDVHDYRIAPRAYWDRSVSELYASTKQRGEIQGCIDKVGLKLDDQSARLFQRYLPFGAQHLEKRRARFGDLTRCERALYEVMYRARVLGAQDAIDRYLEALRELGIYERALIIVTSDHGESLLDEVGWDEKLAAGHNHILHNNLWVPLWVKTPRAKPMGGRDLAARIGLVDLRRLVTDLLNNGSSRLLQDGFERSGPIRFASMADGIGAVLRDGTVCAWRTSDASILPAAPFRLLLSGETRSASDSARACAKAGKNWSAGVGIREVPTDETLLRRLRAIGYIE